VQLLLHLGRAGLVEVSVLQHLVHVLVVVVGLHLLLEVRGVHLAADHVVQLFHDAPVVLVLLFSGLVEVRCHLVDQLYGGVQILQLVVGVFVSQRECGVLGVVNGGYLLLE